MRLPSRLQLGKGTSLEVQRLKLHTYTAGVQVQSLVRELRSHLPGGAAKNVKPFETDISQGQSHLKAWLGLQIHYRGGALAWLLARGPCHVSGLSVMTPGFPRASDTGKGMKEATPSFMT